MKKAKWIIIPALSLLLAGCVSQSKYDTLEQEKADLSTQLATIKGDLDKSKKKAEEQAKQLVERDEVLKENKQLKEKLDLYRQQVNPNSVDTNQQNLTIEEEYINSFLQVYDFQAKYFDSLLDGNVPGVKFKIKNKGNKTLSYVKATVYFKDTEGNNIAEDSYAVVNDYNFDYKELKPNYTYQIEKDKFYTSKTVPSEWKAGNAEIKITEIKFKEE